jgi:thiol-disulfide isomerase/thioredoxin
MEFVNKERMEPPVLIERDHESLTITWRQPSVPPAHYELEMSKTEDEESWSVISSTLKQHLVRKKNLDSKTPYRFRIRFEDKDGNWSPFSAPSDSFYPLSPDFQFAQPPTLLSAEANALTVQWNEITGAEGYRLRYRKDTDISWSMIDSEIKSNRAKKKGLQTGAAYYFSVLPVGEAESVANYTFSLSGGPFLTPTLHPFYHDLLSKSLIKFENGSLKKSVDLSEALAGKTAIALYFSAHWCPPCRQFTPQLIDLYKQLHQRNNTKLEVIFVSCDHTEEEFLSYFQSMPWLAIPFDDHKREQVQGKFHVSGIPKLTILNGNGQVLEENAVQKGISLQQMELWTK